MAAETETQDLGTSHDGSPILAIRDGKAIFVDETDARLLLEAMHRKKLSRDEKASLDVQCHPDGQTLEATMVGASFFIPYSSTAHSREAGFDDLADGVLDRLRTRKSMLPDRGYGISDIHRSAIGALEQVMAEGCTAEELDSIAKDCTKRLKSLEDPSAKSKARLDVLIERLGRLLAMRTKAEVERAKLAEEKNG